METVEPGFRGQSGEHATAVNPKRLGFPGVSSSGCAVGVLVLAPERRWTRRLPQRLLPLGLVLAAATRWSKWATQWSMRIASTIRSICRPSPTAVRLSPVTAGVPTRGW